MSAASDKAANAALRAAIHDYAVSLVAAAGSVTVQPSIIFANAQRMAQAEVAFLDANFPVP